MQKSRLNTASLQPFLQIQPTPDSRGHSSTFGNTNHHCVASGRKMFSANAVRQLQSNVKLLRLCSSKISSTQPARFFDRQLRQINGNDLAYSATRRSIPTAQNSLARSAGQFSSIGSA